MEKKCSFCDLPIEPGRGKMYVKRDGAVFYFCSSKCERNMIKLGRKRRKVKWAAKAAMRFHKINTRPEIRK